MPAAKSAMLGPLHQTLAFQLSLQLFAISDAHFMRMFMGKGLGSPLSTCHMQQCMRRTHSYWHGFDSSSDLPLETHIFCQAYHKSATVWQQW